MREIKFRFWDTRFNRFEPAGYIFGPDEPQFPTDKIIPQQYAGLKDKNGVEIYEGDILEYKAPDGSGSDFYRVDYVPAKFVTYWLNASEKSIKINDLSDPDEDLEVIGNIYENPELLTNPTEEA